MTSAHGKRGVAAAAAFIAAAATLALTTPADAGNGPPAQNLLIQIVITDPDGGAQAVADAITPELFTEPGGVNVANSVMCNITTDTTSVPATTDALVIVACALPVGDSFRLGDGNPPTGFSANSAGCDSSDTPQEALPGDGRTFTQGGPATFCGVFIGPTPTLYVDKIVNGGTATASDFALEVYDVDGSRVDIGTVADPADAVCVPTDDGEGMSNPADCAAIPLANGSYTFGEVLPTYGYIADQMDCGPLDGAIGAEKLRSPAFDFVHSPKARNTYCTITNTYVTDTIDVDLVVVNDSGRTAVGAAFMIEVYDNTGKLVASAPDPEPGTGNASATFTLPIGPYTLGFSGPNGYDGTATVTVEERPRAQIGGPGAQFTIADAVTTAIVTVDDQAPVATTAPPTTAAPTTAAPTTAAPTTAAPTTAAPTVDPNAVLPATGSTSTWPLILLALGFILFGGLTVGATRRR